MKVDFTKRLVNLNKEPLTLNGKECTLKAACVEALMGAFQGEGAVTAEEKMKRFKLAKKVHAAEGETGLAAEEVVMLKAQLNKAFGTLVVGPAFEMLDA